MNLAINKLFCEGDAFSYLFQKVCMFWGSVLEKKKNLVW